MAKDLFLNPNTHDLDIQNGIIRLTQTTQEAARQKVSIVLKTFRGEWEFNINFGIPYLENENNPIQLLGKIDKNIFDAYIKEAILERDGIVSMRRYSSSLNPYTSTLTIDFEAITETGEIISPVSPVEIDI